MPKLLPEAKSRILAAAKKLLFEKGYGGLALREVAGQCGLAVGTIYNYFSSKDRLVASVMAEDWMEALEAMKKGCDEAVDVEQGVRAIYDAVEAFSRVYEPIWSGYKGLPSEFGMRHLMLRGQLSRLLASLLKRLGRGEDARLCPLLAETILACALQKDIDYPELSEAVRRLFQ